MEPSGLGFAKPVWWVFEPWGRKLLPGWGGIAAKIHLCRAWNKICLFIEQHLWEMRGMSTALTAPDGLSASRDSRVFRSCRAHSTMFQSIYFMQPLQGGSGARFWLNLVMPSKIPSSPWVDSCAEQHYSPLPERFWVDHEAETSIKVNRPMQSSRKIQTQPNQIWDFRKEMTNWTCGVQCGTLLIPELSSHFFSTQIFFPLFSKVVETGPGMRILSILWLFPN